MIFVDSSAFIALIDGDQPDHPAASAAWLRLIESHDSFLTTNYVRLETVAVIQRRLGSAAVRAFLADLAPAVGMEWVTPEDHAAGEAALIAARRRNLSLTDCVSFEVMRRLRLDRAFAFDNHFREQGFRLVR